MNITPALNNPYLPQSEPDRSVSAVRPTDRSRDALDTERREQPPAKRLDPAERNTLGARVEAFAQRMDPGLSARANRALASYAEVADDDERSGIRSMLGFDEYA